MEGMVGEKGILPERSEWFRSRLYMYPLASTATIGPHGRRKGRVHRLTLGMRADAATGHLLSSLDRIAAAVLPSCASDTKGALWPPSATATPANSASRKNMSST